MSRSATLDEGHGFSRAIKAMQTTASAAEVLFRAPMQLRVRYDKKRTRG